MSLDAAISLHIVTMTRRSQFEQEKGHVENLLKHLSVSYDSLEKGEDPPDILVILKNRPIVAVEVTEYHQTRDMRSREGAWEDIAGRITKQRKSSYADLDELHAYFHFKKGSLPSKGKRDMFVTDALELARAVSQDSLSKRQIRTFESGTLSHYLNSIDIESAGRYCRWNSNVEGGSVGLRESELLRAVRFKKNKQTKCDLGKENIWLLIAGGFRTSQSMGIFDVEDLEKFLELNKELRESHFGAAYLMLYYEDAVFKWTSLHDWKQA